MHDKILRRSLLRGAMSAAALSAAASGGGRIDRALGTNLKLALNGYSFNRALRAGEMTLFDVVDYCAQHGLGALDAVGYYFPGYPQPPNEDYIRRFKRHAFVNGVAISGTGVRNDFATADPRVRAEGIALVKTWIEVAAKLGAPVVRVFAGRERALGDDWPQTLKRLAPPLQECAEFGAQHGVVVGLQNHNDVLFTAAETIEVVEAVDSDWLGVILDVGSLRQSDPYQEIETLLPYAVAWQLKEEVWRGKTPEPVDLAHIKSIIDKVGYRGYLPIETLGDGDHRIKVAEFLGRVREIFG